MTRTSKKVAAATQAGSASKHAILEAALRVFARSGYDGASMPNIAKLANVTPALVHYYFENKDTLWRETIVYSLGELRVEAAAVLRATHTLDPMDRLRTLLQVYAEFAARCPDHFSMIVAEARAESDRFAWLHENYTGLLFEDVVDVLRDARAAGAIREVSLTDLSVMLIGGILVYFTFFPASSKEESDRTSPNAFLDFIFEMLARGIAADHG